MAEFGLWAEMLAMLYFVGGLTIGWWWANRRRSFKRGDGRWDGRHAES